MFSESYDQDLSTWPTFLILPTYLPSYLTTIITFCVGGGGGLCPLNSLCMTDTHTLWLCINQTDWFVWKIFEKCAENQNSEVFLCTVARSGGSSDDQLLKVLLQIWGWHRSSPAFKLADLKPSACDQNYNVIWEIQLRNAVEKYSLEMQFRNTVEKYSREIQLRNTVEKYNWEIQLRNTVEKYSWEIQLRNTIEKYSWEILLRNTVEKYNWEILLISTPNQPCL